MVWYNFSSATLFVNVQIVNEYSDLLTSQLENQKIVSSYFHSHNLVSQDAISCFNMTSNLIPPTQWASGIHGIGFSDNCQICYNFFLWAYIVKVFGDLLFCSFWINSLCFPDQYFETLIREVEEETEREISEGIEKAVGSNQKLQKLQAKLDRCVKEKGFLDEVLFFFCSWVSWNLHLCIAVRLVDKLVLLWWIMSSSARS